MLEFADQRVRDEDSADAKIARAHMADRRVAVDVGEVALCFGRIDEDPDHPWPLHRVALEALACCMMIMIALEAWAKLAGPL